jgi:hypothetical protein
MKDMFDRKRGRILGINVLDLLIIIIVVFAVASYISKPDESVCRGNQMYSCIQDFQRLDSRGFLVAGNITGTYLWDETPFQESGIILPSTLGRLRLRKSNGDIVVIGGERAYLEDVAASLIEMKQIDNYLVVFDMDSKSFESYDALLAYLESVKDKNGADHLYLDVEVAVDAPMTPSERQGITNDLSGMFLVRSTHFSRTEAEGFVMNFVKGELSELAKLNIPDGNIRTNRMRAYAGYSEEPNIEFPGNYHVVDAQGLL